MENSRRQVSDARQNERRHRQTDSVNDRRREIRSIRENDRESLDRRVSSERREARLTSPNTSRHQLSVERRSRQLSTSPSDTRREIRESRRLSDSRDRSTTRDSRQLVSSERVSQRRDSSNEREIRLTNDRQESRLVSDATRRILTLSSKDENNFARNVAERQSTPHERRMATSFTADVDYIPEVKTITLLNTAKVLLLSFLVAQVVSNSSKTKKNW
jgi:hypothetical protein